jgi:hypothetical protein
MKGKVSEGVERVVIVKFAETSSVITEELTKQTYVQKRNRRWCGTWGPSGFAKNPYC